jgi:hypothetical protein
MELVGDPLSLFIKFSILYICVCFLLLWVASKILP